MKLGKPEKSTRKDKKLMIKILKDGKEKIIHFGSSDYKQNYSKEARKNYLSRSKGIKNKKGELTYLDPTSANALSRKYLWNA
tara:strand:+ start:8500 stop:8745 length:246 start_codon:yes stop_codon:yes gene_type:complete